jgi:protein-tyrosine phosphatase
MSQILTYLYLGDSYIGLNNEELEKRKIFAIVNLCGETKKEILEKYKEYFLISKLKDMPDANIKQYFEDGIEFIEKNKNNGNILVHCKS